MRTNKIYWAFRSLIHRRAVSFWSVLWKVRKPFYRSFGIRRVVMSERNPTKSRIAIIATYPDTSSAYEFSLKNIVSGLQANNFQILIVTNSGLPKSLFEYAVKRDIWIIERKNVGRDFGAYQAGILWLKKLGMLSEIERLTLVNDTLFWTDVSASLIGELSKGDWRSIYLNLEPSSHAQSFFISFSDRVLMNRRFEKFWKRYSPLNSRVAAINLGEIKLSTVLIKEGFRCDPYVKPHRIDEAVMRLANSKVKAHLLSIPIGATGGRGVPGVNRFEQKIVEAAATATDGPSVDKIGKFGQRMNSELEQTANFLGRFCFSHAPHRIGLHLFLLFELPLKMDLYKIYSTAEIYNCVAIRDVQIGREFEKIMIERAQVFNEGSRIAIKRRGLSEA